MSIPTAPSDPVCFSCLPLCMILTRSIPACEALNSCMLSLLTPVHELILTPQPVSHPLNSACAATFISWSSATAHSSSTYPAPTAPSTFSTPPSWSPATGPPLPSLWEPSCRICTASWARAGTMQLPPGSHAFGFTWEAERQTLPCTHSTQLPAWLPSDSTSPPLFHHAEV